MLHLQLQLFLLIICLFPSSTGTPAIVTKDPEATGRNDDDMLQDLPTICNKLDKRNGSHAKCSPSEDETNSKSYPLCSEHGNESKDVAAALDVNNVVTNTTHIKLTPALQYNSSQLESEPQAKIVPTEIISNNNLEETEKSSCKNLVVGKSTCKLPPCSSVKSLTGTLSSAGSLPISYLSPPADDSSEADSASAANSSKPPNADELVSAVELAPSTPSNPLDLNTTQLSQTQDPIAVTVQEINDYFNVKDVRIEQLSLSAENVGTVITWLSPDPLTNTNFSAVPTYVDSQARIYLHPVTSK